MERSSRAQVAQEKLATGGASLSRLVGPASALGSIVIPAVCATTPLMPMTPASTLVVSGLTATLGGIAGGCLGSWRRRRHLYLPPTHPDGFVLGMDEQGKAFVWDDRHQVYGGLIVGQSGAGKTNALWNLFFQQVLRGGAAIFVNAKGSEKDLRLLWWLARAAGREHDLRILNAGDPKNSHTWNPIQWGMSEQKQQLLTKLRSFGTNSSTAFWHGAQDEVLLAVIHTLGLGGRPFHIGDVIAGIVSPSAREKLLKVGKWRGYTYLAELMGQYRRNDSFDEQQFVNTQQGLLQVLRRYVYSEAGRIVLTARGEIDLRDIVRKRGLLYVDLPTQTTPDTAFEWGLLLVQALQSVAGDLNRGDDRTHVPVLVELDEIAQYLSKGIERAVQQWRSAGMCLQAATQQIGQFASRENLEIGKALLNTGCKQFFRQEEWEDSEAAARQLGMEIQLRESFSVGTSQARTQKGSGPNYSGTNTSAQHSVREEEDYVVRPEQLRDLKDGVFYVRWAGGHKKLRTPFVNPPDEWLTPVEKLSYPTGSSGSEGMGLWEAHHGEVMAGLGRVEDKK